MSIRYTILLPLLGLMLLAGILSGVTGWVGLGAVDDLSRLGSRTTEMNEASRIARDRFHRAEALIARVSAMTDLLDMAPIQAEFIAAGDQLMALLDRLETLAESERMVTLARSAIS
jgi:methyl-accepting chemotaxis protein